MFIKNQSGVMLSELLGSVPGVSHGYSTRILGDMKKDMQNRKKFLSLLHFDQQKVIVSEQIHGNAVSLIHADGSESIIKSVDALVVKKEAQIPHALGTFAADCVPLLFVDPVANIVAVGHAGWRGTLSGISQNVIRQMEHSGGYASNILVSVGPHIGMCCYTVPKERAVVFKQRFNNDERIVDFSQESWRVDIGQANYQQLVSMGVLPGHIDAPVVCTSCQVEEFFSYRKDLRESFGEMMGVIGFTT